MQQPNPFAEMERMADAEAVLSEWESRFGSAFQALQPFLVQGQTKALVYPCPDCGSSMRVAEHPEEGWLAFHDGADYCNEIQLLEMDLQSYRFNMVRWLERLCQNFSIECAVCQSSSSIWRMGTIRIPRKNCTKY